MHVWDRFDVDHPHLDFYWILKYDGTCEVGLGRLLGNGNSLLIEPLFNFYLCTSTYSSTFTFSANLIF